MISGLATECLNVIVPRQDDAYSPRSADSRCWHGDDGADFRLGRLKPYHRDNRYRLCLTCCRRTGRTKRPQRPHSLAAFFLRCQKSRGFARLAAGPL